MAHSELPWRPFLGHQAWSWTTLRRGNVFLLRLQKFFFIFVTFLRFLTFFLFERFFTYGSTYIIRYAFIHRARWITVVSPYSLLCSASSRKHKETICYPQSVRLTVCPYFIFRMLLRLLGRLLQATRQESAPCANAASIHFVPSVRKRYTCFPILWNALWVRCHNKLLQSWQRKAASLLMRFCQLAIEGCVRSLPI